ncbi:MAG: hypothetical protein IEMM0003_0050 [bacterium]|nr:MAG: hypothetical protein IEMM0003_0050 [bacterium]
MNGLISVLRRLSKTTWVVGILLIMFITVVETLFFAYAYNLNRHYTEQVKNIKLTIFVQQPNNLGKIANLVKSKLGGKQKIIKPNDAIKLLPMQMQKTVGKGYLALVPYIIVASNSQSDFTLERIVKLKSLLTNYNATMGFNRQKIKTAFKNLIDFRLILLGAIVLFVAGNLLFGYIIRRIFIHESRKFSIFLWNLGIQKRFVNLIGLLFFGQIAVAASVLGQIIAFLLLFVLSAVNSIDIQLFAAGIIGIFVINIIVLTAASWGSLK